MSYHFNNRNIEKIAVVGAGQIGPDIALHFAKALSPYQAGVIVLDISAEALEAAEKKIEAKIGKGIASGAFKPAQAESIRQALEFTLDYGKIRGAGIVVEAATEEEGVKDAIFRKVEQIADGDCIFMSNSSHMQPEVIFRNITAKQRCLVAHYFFPAEINPIVEIVPGEGTSATLTHWLLSFYESIGKAPIRVKSAYGYAIDPVFEGLCQVAIQCLEQGLGTEKEIDAAAAKALGLGVGPFTALNLTGGNPITAHGLDELGRLASPWFKTPAMLAEKTRQKEPWNTTRRGETVNLRPEQESRLAEIFQGAYFTLCSFILDTGIVSADDLNMACEIALAIKPPLTFMNRIGIERAAELAEAFRVENPGFPSPQSLQSARAAGGWKVRDIVERREKGVLFITIRRPRVMNALNLEVLAQVREALEDAKNEPGVQAAVITGFGVKAFASGADLQMITSLSTPEEGVQNSHDFQAALNYIAAYPKPVVCALNGFAFGGGSELAMACTARIARKGLPVAFCQPEVKLGFIPGAGGTQRLPRLVGIETAADILRTARQVGLQEALGIGYLDQEAGEGLLADAAALALDIAAGRKQAKILPSAPLSAGEGPKPADIGRLSKKIDDILVRSIYEGYALPLDEGLALESALFGECMRTRDMQIGLENFKTYGPKTPAPFIHQ